MQFVFENCDNDKDQNIYASMARMSGNGKISSTYFGDSLQWTNWVLDSGAMCHTTSQVFDVIPSSLEDRDKYIEVADGNHGT